MDFRLNDDQQALQEGVRAFCEGRVPLERLHALCDTGGFDADLWRDLAELGVFSLRLDESRGGVGLGMADAVVVFAELGRSLVPGPLLWTHLAAGWVEGAAAGEAVVGGLDLMQPNADPLLVAHLDRLDALLLLRADGIYRADPRALGGEPVRIPLDPLTPLHWLSEAPDGERIGGPGDAAQLRLEGSALAATLLFGIAEATQELAVSYALEREQFGRPIGGFQALKHMIADTFVRQELSRAAVYAAGATLDDPEVGDGPRAVASAKLIAGEAALKNARTCLQVYGGMGYTWEMPCHYYLKRAWVLENEFGGVDEHAERVAAAVEAEAAR